MIFKKDKFEIDYRSDEERKYGHIWQKMNSYKYFMVLPNSAEKEQNHQRIANKIISKCTEKNIPVIDFDPKKLNEKDILFISYRIDKIDSEYTISMRFSNSKKDIILDVSESFFEFEEVVDAADSLFGTYKPLDGYKYNLHKSKNRYYMYGGVVICGILLTYFILDYIGNPNTTVPDKKDEVVINSDIDSDIPINDIKYENRFALIIGNEDYSSFQPSLNNEINVTYAKDDAATFKTYAVFTLGVPIDNVIFLINAKSVEMNRAIDKINSISKNLNGQAEIIFYYAGHGFPDQQTKEPYLIPVDVSGSDLKYAVKLSDLYKKLNEHPVKRVTVFLDACFSGGGRKAGLLQARGIKLVPKKTVPSDKSKMIVFTSTDVEQSALPYNEKGHGMFTYYLLKKIQETKGHVSYGELYEYVSKNVAVKSALIKNLEQTPKIYVSPKIHDVWKNWQINM